MLSYTREQLISLRPHAPSKPDLDPELSDIKRKIRKRGCRGGSKVKNRQRGYKPVLPSVITGNVRSLCNKVDELSACVRFDRVYRQSSLLCFTETWLNERTPEAHVTLDGFTLHRMDRDLSRTAKKQGGGVCAYVNERWCHPDHVTVKERLSDVNIELLVVSCRPYYLPREISHVVLIVVYIPPSATGKLATDIISRTTHELQRSSPDALFIITGDFNHCSLSAVLPSFRQMVKCPTRGKKTIDLFYTNIKDSFVSSALPPLGQSDHNLVLLKSIYTPVVQRQPVTYKTVRVWSEEACEALKACFECTDWSVFLEDSEHNDVEDISDRVTCYINYCVDLVIPCKQIKVFANNKPWVTKEVKAAINRKKLAFFKGDDEQIKNAQKELKRVLRQSKRRYKDKLERSMDTCNPKGLWDSMKTITGYGVDKPSVRSEMNVNDMNQFFARFDEFDFSLEHQKLSTALADRNMENPGDQITFTVSDVQQQLKRLKPNKSAGPDGVNPRTLKVCADQLGSVLHYIFMLSLSCAKIPTMWKTSCLVPIPKKANIKGSLSNLRPIALTSHIMKCFERVVLCQLRIQVASFLDPLQFAYREGVSVDDALLYMLHTIYQHLENTGSSVRIMFFDFSSAFNTLQPHILASKLLDFKLHNRTVAWILDYLLNRPQFVRLGDRCSDTILTKTGAPQGTVLSPFLFTLYTSEYSHSSAFCHLQKFSDDTALLGLISYGDDRAYREEIDSFVSWCDSHFLQLNVAKTQELIIDFRKKKQTVVPVFIKGKPIETVDTYKYLGVHLDNKLNWKRNSDAVVKKTQSRMFFLRKLQSFEVNRRLMNVFYQGAVASVLFYAVLSWGGSISVEDRNRINKLIKKSSSIIGLSLDSMDIILDKRMRAKVQTVLALKDHPLHSIFSGLKSSFSERLVMPRCSTERLRNSFVPAAVRFYNEHFI